MHALNHLYLLAVIPAVSLLIAVVLGLYEAMTNGGHGMYDKDKAPSKLEPWPNQTVKRDWV